MGIAVIIPNVNYGDANLGQVTLQSGVPLRSMTIVGPDEVSEPTVFNVNFFPANTSQRGIAWSVVSGGTYASIDEDTGELTPIVGAVLNDVVIRATSTADSDIYAEKTVTVSYGMVYAEKTALVGDGVAAIKTNYFLAKNSKLIYEYKINALPTPSGTTQYRNIWSAYSGSGHISRHLLQIGTSVTVPQRINFGALNSTSNDTGTRTDNETSTPPLNVRIKQEADLNGFVSSYRQTDFVSYIYDTFYAPGDSVALFAQNGSANVLEMSFYCFQAEENGILKLDLVPCTLLSDIDSSHAGDSQAHLAGENGMWDKVGKKFYGNYNNSGSFSVID